MEIRLLIAEVHDLVREGLRIVLAESEINVVGEATTGTDAVRAASAGKAGVMLLDIKMPDDDGFDILRKIQSANKELAVLVYSQHERSDFQARARELGASGYLTKRARADELIDAIRKVSQGKSVWPTTNNDVHQRRSGRNEDDGPMKSSLSPGV